MKKVILILLSFSSINAFALRNAGKEVQNIVSEGKILYKSEMASWHGTDLFLKKYKKRENIGGYFSYTDKDVSKCIFFSMSNFPKVIGTISFDSTFNLKTATIDLKERLFTAYESDLYAIREKALAEAKTDTLFKIYKNTSLNFIPLITGKEKKVYVLTGPKQDGVVIFGNDYLLTFDKKNQLKLKKQLHQNIIQFKYDDITEDGEKIETTIHSHSSESGDLMTPTDICTLMLYAKFAKWTTHQVVSQKYLNIWDCKTEQLDIITMDAVDKILEDQEIRNK